MTSRSKRPRAPGVIHGALGLAVLVLLTFVALTARQPPPPSIAEFAPKAVEQIEDAPAELASSVGSAEGGGSGGSGGAPTTTSTTTTVPAATERVIEVARVRNCIGDPPRQIEDPQSPPCIAYWEGDNGGATWQGVTDDEIIVAAPHIETGPGQGADELTPIAQALEAFFNRRFEFYGRKLRLVKFPGPGPSSEPDAEQQQAHAVAVDEEIGAFASLPYAEQGGAEHYYNDELARRGVVSVYSGRGVAADEGHFRGRHPYQWSIVPGSTAISANLAEWVCKQLAGRNAEYAGSGSMGPRKFGLIIMQAPDGTTANVDPLVSGLTRCGVEVKKTAPIVYGDDSSAAVQNAMLAMQQAGVTSIIPYMQAATLYVQAMPAASRGLYYPEWVLSSYASQIHDSLGLLGPPEQAAHAFGILSWNKPVAAPDLPVNWAVKEANPDLTAGWDENIYLYWPLLVLASGIQMAGPNLTPDTFAAALQQTEFPNPGAGRAPYFQAHVGFGTDHAFFNDATPAWWNPAAFSHQIRQRWGAYCYPDDGIRYRLGQWPTARIAMFDGTGCPMAQ